MAGTAQGGVSSEGYNNQAVRGEELWQIGKPVPNAGGAIDVWRVNLTQPEQTFHRLTGLLSQEELERAGRFHFQEHREKFIVAHGVLREILSRYLGISGLSIQFTTSFYGKPSLSGELTDVELNFNLSHSQELALIAVGERKNIGVDLEFMRSDLADEQIARRFFSRLEVESYLALPEALRKEAFFTCWTRKEAYIKAIGEGLSMPLDQFDVTLIPGSPAKLLHTRPDPAQALQWNLYTLKPGPEYCAALAVQGEVDGVNCWQWSEL